MKKIFFFILLLPILLQGFPTPQIDFNPKHYICFKSTETIEINGKLNEESWEKCNWSDYFVDIEGNLKPEPRFKTRIKMLWDDQYFYFAAEMEEPHIWANLKERDAVIFYDNDFEIFIDPQGDTHNYYEFEINALNTVWDLLITEPYRESRCRAIDSWDIQGLQTAVYIDGTLNDPSDIDNRWYVEIAMPWKVLEECSDQTPPIDGDQWRVNFSRVEWNVHYEDNNYHKTKQPEDNWVWSPQGLIAMHYPEMWGFVQFTALAVGSDTPKFIANSVEDAKWALRQLYYSQKEYYERFHCYTDYIVDLRLQDIQLDNYFWPPKIYVTPSGYEAILISTNKLLELHIRENGRVWKE